MTHPPDGTARRVLLCLSTPMNYAMLRPLHEALARDPRLRITFTVRVPAGRTLRRTGLRGVRRLPPPLARLVRHDLALCPGYFFRGGRIGTKVQVFHGTSLKHYAISPEARAYDRLFLIGPHMREKFVEAGLFPPGDPRLRDIGMPKLDALFDPAFRRGEVLARIGAPPGRPVVLYAPTWSSSTPSSLDTVGAALIETLSRMEDVTLLVKLHDKSLKAFRRRAGTDWEAALDRYRGRAWRVPDYDITPWLAAADLLVSDVSSVAYEYTLLDRPILFMENPEKLDRIARSKPGADLVTWGRSCGEVVRRVEELPGAIRRALCDPGALGEVRRAFARRFFYNPGRATAAALAAVYEALALSPP